MPQKAPFECPTCKLNITKSQCSIGCGSCGVYYHVKCADVSEDKLTSIRKNISKFICTECKDCVSVDSSRDILKRMDEIQKAIETKLEATKYDIERRVDSGFLNFDTKINQLINNVRTEVKNEMAKVKNDITHCISCVHKAEESIEAKYQLLQAKNNRLERRLNRSDILVSGLTCSLDNVSECMSKIGNLIGVVINGSDIYHCCYVNSRKQFLVKFNSVQLRDVIMSKYFKCQPLLLKNVIGGSIESRIYLNDNLSSASLKLQHICRKLLAAKKIKKYYILNMDMPKAKIIKIDGKSVVWDTMQCASCLGELAVVDEAVGLAESSGETYSLK